MRVAVVGGGALGVTAAHDLADRGADVTLYERDRVGSGASGRAAGIAYDAFAGEVDVRVAARALSRFRALDEAGAISFTECPYVWLARAGDERRAAAIRDQVERMRGRDRDVELLEREALADRFPALAADDVAVAAVARDAGHLDPGLYVTAMADRAAAAGAAVETDREVSLALDGGPAVAADGERVRYDAVLVAAGAHTKRLLADVGVRVPVKPYRVQALATGAVDVDVPMVYDATESYYVRPRGDGVLVGDGTEEREFDPDDYDADADGSFVAASLDRLGDAVPALDPSALTVTEAWAGLCTATPDRDPLLGPVGPDGLYVATGWHGHGFMRSPALGEAVAEQILGDGGVERFDPRRFDGDEEFEVVEGMTVDE